jgi:hypothetical protein
MYLRAGDFDASARAALLQLCCSSVAALLQLCCSSVAALLQLCCSSVAALLELCCTICSLTYILVQATLTRWSERPATAATELQQTCNRTATDLQQPDIYTSTGDVDALEREAVPGQARPTEAANGWPTVAHLLGCCSSVAALLIY